MLIITHPINFKAYKLLMICIIYANDDFDPLYTLYRVNDDGNISTTPQISYV